ncbi:hypothetical protein ACXWYY_002998 [Enterobacter hormaechei]|nr:hypothetical protein [Enterobacter hormaechei]
MEKYMLEPLSTERKAAIARTVLDDLATNSIVEQTDVHGVVFGQTCSIFESARTHAIEVFDTAFKEVASVTAVIVGEFSNIK